jgi:type III pantothenate kinase
MMLVCIDVGNTHTVIGLLDGIEVKQHWRVSTDERRTADEWAVLISGLLSGPRTALPNPAADIPVRPPADGIALCSTVPMVLHEMREMLAQYFADVPQVVIEPGVRTGVPVLMDNPREVGTDRIVNALAAAQLYPGPRIVVDFGTATTFDVVSAKGEYVGGAIAPGIEISLEALGRRGAQLRKVELLRPRAVIAKNTVEALQSGTVYGFAGQVDGIVARMVAELGVSRGDVTVIGTGGLAAVVLAECTSIDVYEPLLTLMGLRLAFDRVRSSR